jgi:hypothetical protein
MNVLWTRVTLFTITSLVLIHAFSRMQMKIKTLECMISSVHCAHTDPAVCHIFNMPVEDYHEAMFQCFYNLWSVPTEYLLGAWTLFFYLSYAIATYFILYLGVHIIILWLRAFKDVLIAFTE